MYAKPTAKRGVHRRPDVHVRIGCHLAGEIEQKERQRRHRASGDRRGEHPARRARQDQREQDDHRGNPGEVRQDPVDDVVLPERHHRDHEADRDLVCQAKRVQAGRGDVGAACDPPQPGGRPTAATLTSLERPVSKKLLGSG